ncbi:MAG: sensor histidine kinase [Roseiflexaceae bacterium]
MKSLRMRLLQANLTLVIFTMVIFVIITMIITPRVHDRMMADERRRGGPNAMIFDGTIVIEGRNEKGETVIAVPDTLLRAELLYRNAVWRSIWISMALAMGLSLVTSFTLARVLAAPLQQLAQASRRIAGGNFTPIQISEGATEVQELASQFNHMAQALNDAEQRRAALIGDVAHELRTPLTSIQGYAEGILDGVMQPDARNIAIIRDEAHRMHRLVDDLQSLSRAEAGTLTLYRAQTDLIEIIRRASALLEGIATEHKVTIEVSHAYSTELVECDADRISQVLLNLLTNAIRVSPVNSRIEITTGHDPTTVWCRVRDFGEGIDAPHLPHIFERFYRVDPSRARTTGGAGVGLTIARAIVEAHGGTLTAQSDGLGKGATFVMTLPRN